MGMSPREEKDGMDGDVPDTRRGRAGHETGRAGHEKGTCRTRVGLCAGRRALGYLRRERRQSGLLMRSALSTCADSGEACA